MDINWERRAFATPGGKSALRATRRGNPRNLLCPTCGRPNPLTPEDVRRGIIGFTLSCYQCDRCADRLEGAL